MRELQNVLAACAITLGVVGWAEALSGCHLTPAQDAALAAGGAALCRALVPVAGGSPELAVEACAGAEALVGAALAAAQPSIPAAPSPPAGKPRVALVAGGRVVGYAPAHVHPWVQAAIDAR